MCLCFDCSGVGGFGGECVGVLGQGQGGWCYVCESGFSVLMTGPDICILC